MIVLKNIKKEFKGKKIFIDLSLEINSSSIVVLKGKNGCGKTTLLKMILGLIAADGGKIKYNDATYAGLIEEPAFDYSLSGRKNIELLLKKINENYLDDLLTKFDLRSYFYKKVKTYSLGMKQKLAIIFLALKNPDFLFLDEPINSLDSNSVSVVRKIIEERKKAGLTTFIVSHQTRWLNNICDYIYEIKDYTIVESKRSDDSFLNYLFVFKTEADAKDACAFINANEVSEKEISMRIEEEEVSNYIRELTKYNLMQVRIVEDGDLYEM